MSNVYFPSSQIGATESSPSVNHTTSPNPTFQSMFSPPDSLIQHPSPQITCSSTPLHNKHWRHFPFHYSAQPLRWNRTLISPNNSKYIPCCIAENAISSHVGGSSRRWVMG